MAYEGTQVNYMKSQAQIGVILAKNGVLDKVFYDKVSEKKVQLMFKYPLKFEDKTIDVGVKIEVPNITEKNRNQKYRLIYWYLKSKFEAINEKLFEDIGTTFIKEFYAHLLVNQSQTLYESLAPQLQSALLEGKSTPNKFMIDFEKKNGK